MTNPAGGDDLAKRRVPSLITYLSPFRIVEKDETTPRWTATIEQVNRREWDYVSLHEIVGGLDVGLPAPYHMVVARDGALGLPPLPELRSDQAAVEFFNRCLGALLLGGIYCEAIAPDGLDLGSIIDWKYVRSHRDGASASNRFHKHIRYRNASALESIQLHKPRTTTIAQLDGAMKVGLEALRCLAPVQGEYLLEGATGLARRDWGAALANLWIVTEQLLEALWTREVVQPSRLTDTSKARREQLTDSRLWTSAARIELLHQKGVFDLQTLTTLSKARKARNDLSHRGQHPSYEDAAAAYEGVRLLIGVVLGHSTLPIFGLDLSDHALSDPFAPRHGGKLEPEFWMEIPKLPGEEELERAEAVARSDSTASTR